LKKKIWFSVNILISAVFLWLALRGVDYGEMIDSFTRVNYFWVLASVGINIFSCWLRAVRWQYLMLPVARIKTNRMFSALMIGFMVNNILPFRLGEFMRGIALKRTERVSFSASMGSVAIERVIDVITLMMIFGLTLIFFPFPLWVKSGSVIILIIIAVSILIWYLMVHHTEATVAFLERFSQRWMKKSSARISQIVRSFIVGMSLIKSWKFLSVIFIQSAVVWGTYIFAILAMFYAMNMDITYALGLLESTVVMIFTSFAIMIPAAPGYVGTYHEIAKQGLLMFRVDKELAVGWAILSHAYNYISITGIGLYYYFKNNLNLKELFQPMNEND